MTVVEVVSPPRAFLRRLEPWTLMAWLLPTAVVLLAPLPTGDLAYQIRAGRLMWASHEILRHDVFTYTFGGRAWVDQQWGAQLILGALFPMVGWRGLVVLRAIIVGAVVGLTFRRTRANGADPAMSGTLSIGAFLIATLVPGTTVLRPQLFALPLFVASAWIVQTRRARPRSLLALPVIGVVWANLHGSFLLLPLLLLPAVIDDVIDHDRGRWLTFGVAVAALVTPLANPWGANIYGYVAHLATSPTIRSSVQEWRPLFSNVLAGVTFVAANAVIVVVVLRRGSRDPSPGEVVGWAAFTALALMSARNTIWWALYVPPVAGGILTDGSRSLRGPDARATAVIASILVSLIAVGTIRTVTTPPTDLLEEAPQGVTAAVRAATAHGQRVFNGSWGSWFEFALPNVPVFLDARGEMTPDTVYRDYSVVMSAQPRWEDVLNRWNVAVVAVPADDPELLATLERAPGWTTAYIDDDGAVFTRS